MVLLKHSLMLPPPHPIPLQEGYTPLNWAAYSDNASVVSILLADSRVDVNEKDHVRGEYMHRGGDFGLL